MDVMSLSEETRAVHVPVVEPQGSSPAATPLHLNHQFVFDSTEGLVGAFDGPDAPFLYARMGNPTVRTLEDAITDLEGGEGALAYASGMGAISTVLTALVGSGDHVIAQRSLYGGTHAFLSDLQARWGVEVDHVSGSDPEEVRALLRPNTRVLYLETIANPTTRVSDLPALAAAVRGRGVTTVVDNTFATPLLCRPLEHGADVVVHSTSKYLSGHGDALGGAAVFASGELRRRVWDQGTMLGAVASPFNAWQTLRGLRTLELRVRRQCENARELAERLSRHPAVAAVHHPDLPDHPDREVAERILKAGGAVLSFDLKGGGREEAAAFAEALRLVRLSPSLGEVATLVMPPASTSHHKLSAEELRAAGIGAGMVRVAVGIEGIEDLWQDVEQALSKLD
ncbi:trans-sulfuration enzyme family protein [Nocardiopsis potens]|uniref:trans-sulfuration enzyme family protein n=1 Tax=Nocardiopsis potens TaxID=1246458 RepID=UPI000373EC17|nr:aminotransferase class I/II-fold pyridoxal phosphate-dependent enzyme [Nocardiopsis potens]